MNNDDSTITIVFDKDSGADQTLLTKGRDPMLTELKPTPTLSVSLS